VARKRSRATLRHCKRIAQALVRCRNQRERAVGANGKLAIANMAQMLA
jgi:hypothetical protein